MSAPSVGVAIGPAISGPAFGPVMSGPSFSLVNEGPAPIGSFDNFSPLIPSAPDLGGTVGPVDVLNSAFPIVEPRHMANIFNEGPAPVSFLENTRPLSFEDFSYNPDRMDVVVGAIKNPFLDPRTSLRGSRTVSGAGDEAISSPVYEIASLNYRFARNDGEVFEPTPLEFEFPRVIKPAEITIGVAQPLVKDEEELEEQLEQVRQTIKKITTHLNRAPRVLSTVRVDSATAPQVVSEQQEVIYEVEEKKEENKSFKEKSKIELTVKKLIKDQNVLVRRLADARAAIEQAFYQLQKNGKKAVSGEDVEQYVPSEYTDVRSGVLKKKSDDEIPDGSYVLGKADIRKIRETSSKEEMLTKVNEAIYGNGPVTESSGQEGEEATEEEVEKVYLYRKGRPPIRIFERRVIKKKEMDNSQTNFNGNTKISEVPEKEEVSEEESEELKPLLKEVFKVAA